MMMTMKNWQAEIHHIQQPQPRGIIPLYLELIKENNANISFNFCADVKDFLVTSVLSCHQVGFHDLQALLTAKTHTTFCAHLSYMGGPWYDCAWIRWYQYPDALPARIRAFVDLITMMPRTSIDIHESGQYVIGPGLYAFVELFREVLEGNQDNPDEDPEYSNTLIGCYERDET
jgi:hypothetical protein